MPKSAGLSALAIATGLVFLIAGSKVLLIGAVGIAHGLGVSEAVIGLTLVAVGTSLPELTISVIAALRRHADVAVGNVLGSNIFNLLSVLGLTSLIAPGGINVPPGVLAFDLPIMIAIAIACLPIFYTGNLVARWEGALFLCYYIAYVAYIIIDNAGHDTLPLFSTTMLLFALPMTMLGLAFSFWRDARSRRAIRSAGSA